MERSKRNFFFFLWRVVILKKNIKLFNHYPKKWINMIIIKNKYVPTTESINLIQRVSNWMEIFLKIFFWEYKKIALFPKRQMVGGTDSKIIIIKMTQKKN